MDYRKLVKQRCALAAAPELWQFDLLTPQKLCKFARDRGVPIFNASTITDLWRVGLLRADLITARRKFDIPWLELVSQESGLFVYCDARQVEHRTRGYGGAFAAANSEFPPLELMFHPFRLYILYQIDRVFRMEASSTQYLLNPEGMAWLANHNVESLDIWTSDPVFSQRFDHWNKSSELAIVLEPTAYSKVFHAIRWKYPDTEDGLRDKMRERRGHVQRFLSECGTNAIHKIRVELCQDAEILDPNKLVHVLLRLMSRHERLKLRGALGGCMLFLCMAELIRRAAGEALGQDMPEEDELGFGQWLPGARKSIYGSERILDASRETRRDFLASMGLDYGVKVRCYVEGETELGALTSAVGEAGGIEFVNLRGQVVEKRGKGLSFVASLRNDMRSHVFSVVVLDQDREDYVRALKKAAREKTFFGRFFISSPDFELANFTVRELVEVLPDVAGEMAIKRGRETRFCRLWRVLNPGSNLLTLL